MLPAWSTGAAINVIGSIFINLGTNIMKLGHNRRAASTLLDKPPIRTFRPWQLGVALFAFGNVLNFCSFGFAAQSLLAALGSVQFLSNVVFASVVLGEKVTRRIIFATLCIFTGCVLLVSFGNHESDTLAVSDMLQFYASPIYITYLALLILAAGCLSFTYHYGQQKLAWMGREAGEDKWVKLLPVSYALYSGMVGTQSVLFCKTLSTLLRTTVAGDSQLQSWFFWLTFLAFIATAVFWISRLNMALQLFPAIMIVPLMQISWTLFSILSGGIYFQEYETLSIAQGCGYAFGVIIVFLGVYLLTPRGSYMRLSNDLEAGLFGAMPGSGEGVAPLVDLRAPLAASQFSATSNSSGQRSLDAQESVQMLPNHHAGLLKGLASCNQANAPGHGFRLSHGNCCQDSNVGPTSLLSFPAVCDFSMKLLEAVESYHEAIRWALQVSRQEIRNSAERSDNKTLAVNSTTHFWRDAVLSPKSAALILQRQLESAACRRFPGSDEQLTWHIATVPVQ